ncbi:MAG: potassium transporter [Gammaproteobacteria bacterium SG8_11]|nr:MAG: potassium transporter [Gammaproteobacteria bacterium SG8_11]
MRAVFIGASALTIMTSKILLKRAHEIVIVESNKEKIAALSNEMDCGFIAGDGSKPAILKETNPGETDVLFCLTNDDRSNILASLVGRSLGFQRIVTRIEDPELEHICIELGLEDTIIPARTIGRHLSDMVEGRDPFVLSTLIRDEARVFSFVLHDADECALSELPIPEKSRVICLYRDNKFLVPRDDEKLKSNDEILIITHRDNLHALKERWVNKAQ